MKNQLSSLFLFLLLLLLHFLLFFLLLSLLLLLLLLLLPLLIITVGQTTDTYPDVIKASVGRKDAAASISKKSSPCASSISELWVRVARAWTDAIIYPWAINPSTSIFLDPATLATTRPDIRQANSKPFFYLVELLEPKIMSPF